jgi:hypothetical protein
MFNLCTHSIPFKDFWVSKQSYPVFRRVSTFFTIEGNSVAFLDCENTCNYKSEFLKSDFENFVLLQESPNSSKRHNTL